MQNGSNWYAVKTYGRQEEIALAYLRGLHIGTFLPYYVPKGKEIPVPMFTGYFFVQFREDTGARAGYEAGVFGFVSFGGRQAIVPNWIIEGLQAGGLSIRIRASRK